jgi:hypothetical protein
VPPSSPSSEDNEEHEDYDAGPAGLRRRMVGNGGAREGGRKGDAREKDGRGRRRERKRRRSRERRTWTSPGTKTSWMCILCVEDKLDVYTYE